jgi:DNA polymerase III delta prime subunit
VFRHFSVKKDEDLKGGLGLRELFQPDYGLRHRQNVPQGQEDQDWREEETVALSLERMRAHILGLSRRDKKSEPLFSLILHGPPGTGKTTLVEALAKSTRTPLVEITPSDIVSSGAEAVERRARAVFKALSLLTRVVILFDEFDPVLKRRDPDSPGPSTVFSFVTPGMLPKLKTLHDMAKKRGVAYTLITNLIGSLDAAAIRSGRFDRKLGIYPPDPLAQQGRLLDEFLAFSRRTDHQLAQDLVARVKFVVQQTAGLALGDLTQRGWFRQPNDLDSIPKGSPFYYLTSQGDFSPRIPEPDTKPSPPPQTRDRTESIKAAEREYRQWTWIQNWDAEVKQSKDNFERPPLEVQTSMNSTPHPVYLSLGPKSPEGFPSILVQVLAGNGDTIDPAK